MLSGQGVSDNVGRGYHRPVALLPLNPDELLTTTRAVRKRLDFTRDVSDEVIRECVSLAMQSPSGSNNMTMQFVIVKDPAKRKAQMDADWAGYAELIRMVEDFHKRIAGRYHATTHAFYGSHANHRAYGTVTWNLRTNRNYFVPGDVLNGTLAASNETGTERTVRMTAPTPAGARGATAGALREETRVFSISEPDENGDGTVPHRSGVAPKPGTSVTESFSLDLANPATGKIFPVQLIHHVEFDAEGQPSPSRTIVVPRHLAGTSAAGRSISFSTSSA